MSTPLILKLTYLSFWFTEAAGPEALCFTIPFTWISFIRDQGLKLRSAGVLWTFCQSLLGTKSESTECSSTHQCPSTQQSTISTLQ